MRSRGRPFEPQPQGQPRRGSIRPSPERAGVSRRPRLCLAPPAATVGVREISRAECWLFSPAGFRYVTCQIHNCSEKTLTAPFPGPIDHSSLTVQDDYIFFQVRLLLGVLATGSRRCGEQAVPGKMELLTQEAIKRLFDFQGLLHS